MMQKAFSKPDFIGIGPPKTGTTWIYRNLSLHPQVWMPPDKEIRYFWERTFIGDLGYRQRSKSTHWHHQARQIFCRERMRSHRQALSSLKFDFKTFYWDAKYTYGNHTDRWYASLFDKDLVSGDISAKYCELPGSEIARIKDSFPDLKVIITLRDPVEREWSRAKMNLCKRRQREVSEVPTREFIDEFNDPPQKESNDYGALVDRWTSHFGAHQVLVLFYDELLSHPVEFFQKLCRFLQISAPDSELQKQLSEVVFKGVKGEIPMEYERILFDMHKDTITGFADSLGAGSYPGRWLEKHRQAVS